jgi:hypothetical protein
MEEKNNGRDVVLSNSKPGSQTLKEEREKIK